MEAHESGYIAWTERTYASYLFYAPLVVTPIGLALNVASIIVFARKKFHSSTMGFYYIALALFDNLALAMFFCGFFSIGIHHDLTLISNASCFLVSYMIRLFGQIPSWIQVLITYDRILTTLFPKRLMFLRNKRVLSAIIGGIVLLIALVNVSNFWFSLRTIPSRANSTTSGLNGTELVCKAPRHIKLIRNMVGASFRAVLPFITMLVGNVLLIRSLVESKRRLSHSGASASSSSSRREHHFAVSVLAMNAVFIVLYLPQVVSALMTGVFEYKPELVSAEFSAAAHMVFHVSLYIGLVNNSSSFLVNLCSNRIFRAELFKATGELSRYFSRAEVLLLLKTNKSESKGELIV